jgi:enoyl-CoA hydratase/carnithine racemase
MVNCVVPREQLTSAAMDLARTIARTPLEFLALEKQALNRCDDLAGMAAGISSSADLAAASHLSPYAARAREILAGQGWRAVLDFLGDANADEAAGSGL